MYGTQTSPTRIDVLLVFENDVEMYGTQTKWFLHLTPTRLRMM